LQEFSKAGEMRTRELEIQTEIRALVQDNNSNPTDAECTPVVDEEDIAHIVASWTGVPVSKLTESESEKLLQMEDTLHTRLIGQEEAVKAVSRAVRRARVGISNPNRPIASFIFSGPDRGG
jgi:ATP-dependent Clp protease ATP-binding subunit ClpC